MSRDLLFSMCPKWNATKTVAMCLRSSTFSANSNQTAHLGEMIRLISVRFSSLSAVRL